MSQNPLSASVKPNQGFQNLIMVITLLLMFLMASRTPLDSDLWWHLQSGRVMSETGKPLVVDIFSYTRDGQAWVNHSWLSEVFLYNLYKLGGWAGISTWMGLMAVIMGAFFLAILPGNLYTRAGFILLAGVCSAPLITPRPQLFSLIFLVILVWFVRHWLEKGGKLIWLLIPSFILWSNLHGGYMLGILYLLACAGGLVLDSVMEELTSKKTILKKAGIIAGMAIGGYLAAAINPNGIRMWLIPFQTVGVDVLRQFIQEWASPDFHGIETWPFAFYLIFLIFCLARKTRQVSFEKLVPAIFFILLGLYARRNMAVAVIVSLPVLVEAWNDLQAHDYFKLLVPASLQNWYTNYQANRSAELSDRKKRVINLLFAGIVGLGCFLKLAAVNHPTLVTTFEHKYYPAKAVDFLEHQSSMTEGHLFNTYNWGGYLEWKSPQTRVFVDGRTDLFGDEILGEWLTISQGGEGWERLLSKWQVTRVMIEPTRPLASALAADGWVERYRDSIAVIFDKGKP